MPRGLAIEWTRDQLEEIMVLEGSNAHREYAEANGVAINTIYSVRSKVRVLGGVDNFLSQQHVQTRMRQETLTEQLERLYAITCAGAGRSNGHVQYTITIPSRLAERFVELHGKQIRFVPTDDGILIVPVPRQPLPEIPTWANDKDEA
jgi:phosphotransferase system IIB component